MWQWTVPVCVHSIVVVCWLCCDEWAHEKTDKPMDKKQVASLCKALRRNRKLNGLYLRGLNTPQQKRASWVFDVMNGTMFDCPQATKLEMKVSSTSQTIPSWTRSSQHLTCAVCWHLTMALVVMMWLDWWYVVLVCVDRQPCWGWWHESVVWSVDWKHNTDKSEHGLFVVDDAFENGTNGWDGWMAMDREWYWWWWYCCTEPCVGEWRNSARINQPLWCASLFVRAPHLWMCLHEPCFVTCVDMAQGTSLKGNVQSVLVRCWK